MQIQAGDDVFGDRACIAAGGVAEGDACRV
jgi:hypothetical protein